MAIDEENIVFVVYDPPRGDFPFLSAIFFPGKDDPMITAFPTVEMAEEFNKRMAFDFAKKNKMTE